MNEKILLIDGHSILNRAFFGVPDLTNDEGLHTNAIYGFLNILFKVLDEEQPEYLTVAFDVHAPTFRHEMYDAYKGTRKPMAEELRQQVPIMKEVLNAMGIRVIAFDVHAPTFRHEMYDAYKGTRKPMAEELRQQVPIMKEVLNAMGIRVIEKAGLEADDLIGTLSKRCEENGMEVTVLSGDRDLLQLATNRVKIRIPKTKQGRTEVEIIMRRM